MIKKNKAFITYLKFPCIGLAIVIALLMISNQVKSNQIQDPKLGGTYTPPDGIPKNIVLIIGEEMGQNQITAAAAVSESDIDISGFPVYGFIKPWSNTSQIISGNDYYNLLFKSAMTGKDENSKNPESLVDIVKRKNMNLGMVLTGSPTDDLPSAFFVKDYQSLTPEERAASIYTLQPNVIYAGGEDYFTKRTDNRNLLLEFNKQGYLISSKKPGKEITGKIIDFSSRGNLKGVASRGNYLEDAAGAAIRALFPSHYGYFLLIDNNQIAEGAAMKNNLYYAGLETADLLKTAALVAKNVSSKETLVIILGTPSVGSVGFKSVNQQKNQFTAAWDGNNPNASLVPVFASGPGQKNSQGSTVSVRFIINY